MKILRSAPALHERTPFKIAIVTGLSDPTTCRLSEAQRDLIRLSGLDERSVIPWNFPFIADDSQRNQVTLTKASIANGIQMALSLTRSYQALAAPHWNSLASSADRLLFITGSCGLQLLNSWSNLATSASRIEVLALGPVAFSRGPAKATLVRGSRDRISSFCFKSADIIVSRVGHLDYWDHPQVREIAIRWLRDRTS